MSNTNNVNPSDILRSLMYQSKDGTDDTTLVEGVFVGTIDATHMADEELKEWKEKYHASFQEANTPEELKKFLNDKAKYIDDLDGALDKASDTYLSIGDFYKANLPALTKKAARVIKLKKALSTAVYGYKQQVQKDLKAIK